jgi:class 3 adenylate cyclase/predicted ATPase
MECPSCGVANLADNRSCSNCGTMLAPYCQRCGAAVQPTASFCSNCGAKLVRGNAIAPSPDQVVTKGASQDELERRFLSVMFCDLADSTRMAEQLDPEELRDIISGFRSSCADVCEQYGGYIADFLGDGILVYFGYPRSYENDAERAVLAGLQTIDTIARLNDELAVQDIILGVRIGVASGLVVAGDLISRGGRERRAVTGQTPNLAARLQSIAQPNSVVIAEDTESLIKGLFELEDLGLRSLKGFSHSIRAWRVLERKRFTSRFQALHEQELPPLVGRNSEIAALRSRWERARHGDANVVLLIGEPGIGKSRLVQELSMEIDRDGSSTFLQYSGSPHGRNSALLPFVVNLEQALDLTPSEPAGAKAEKLEHFLRAQAHANPDSAPLLAKLLSLPIEHQYRPLDLSPQDQKERTLAILVDLIVHAARSHPVLMVVEDAQWLDPTSLELLQQMIERIHGLPILILITSRPERSPTFEEGVQITPIVLGRLARQESTRMLHQVLGAENLALEIQSEILEKTDGIPLFIEELTRMVLGTAARLSLHSGKASAPRFSIPATLLGSLTARLDGLGIAKEVAQVAAVIGREFSAGLLGLVLQLTGNEVQDALAQLIGAGILRRKRGAAESSCVFKHALLQTAAYESLVFKKRQQLHRRIAEVLEERFPEVVERQPDFAAQHCANGLLPEKAFKYWRKAGLKAASMSANLEAIAHFKRCLELLPGMPEDANLDELELELQAALASVVVTVWGYTSPDAISAQRRVAELCDKLGDGPRNVHAIFGQWLFHSGRSELIHARSDAKRLAAVAEAEQAPSIMSLASHAVGMSAFYSGEFEKARLELLRAIQLGDIQQPHSHWRSDFQFKNRLPLAVNYLSWSLFILGQPDQALSYSRRISEDIRKLGDTYVEVVALTNSCYLHQFCRDWQAVEDRSATVLTLANEKQFAVFATTAKIFREWALASAGHAVSDLDVITNGLASIRESGTNEDLCYFHALGAEILARAGRVEQALEMVTAAIRDAEVATERWYLAELYRLRGDLHRASSPQRKEEALEDLRRALQIAREQHAHFWELRAATSLYHLMAQDGQADEALAAVESICAWFQEGSNLPDLKEARMLIGRPGLHLRNL